MSLLWPTVCYVYMADIARLSTWSRKKNVCVNFFVSGWISSGAIRATQNNSEMILSVLWRTTLSVYCKINFLRVVKVQLSSTSREAMALNTSTRKQKLKIPNFCDACALTSIRLNPYRHTDCTFIRASSRLAPTPIFATSIDVKKITSQWVDCIASKPGSRTAQCNIKHTGHSILPTSWRGKEVSHSPTSSGNPVNALAIGISAQQITTIVLVAVDPVNSMPKNMDTSSRLSSQAVCHRSASILSRSLLRIHDFDLLA